MELTLVLTATFAKTLLIEFNIDADVERDEIPLTLTEENEVMFVWRLGKRLPMQGNNSRIAYIDSISTSLITIIDGVLDSIESLDALCEIRRRMISYDDVNLLKRIDNRILTLLSRFMTIALSVNYKTD